MPIRFRGRVLFSGLRRSFPPCILVMSKNDRRARMMAEAKRAEPKRRRRNCIDRMRRALAQRQCQKRGGDPAGKVMLQLLAILSAGLALLPPIPMPSFSFFPPPRRPRPLAFPRLRVGRYGGCPMIESVLRSSPGSRNHGLRGRQTLAILMTRTAARLRGTWNGVSIRRTIEPVAAPRLPGRSS